MKFSNLYKLAVLLTFVLLLFSCGSERFDSEEALWAYLKEEDNGYLYKKQVKGIDYSLVYRPTDLLVQQTMTTYSEKAVDSLRKHYSQYLYFNLSFSKNNQELLSTVPRDRQQFGAMVNQLVFGMGEYVHVYNNKQDTLQLVDYIYPRMYGVSNGTKMLFVYEANEEELKEENLFLEIKDMGLGTGDVRFKIPTAKIKQQPELNFSLLEK
ncbi:MAG: hypothetical protein PQJ49_00345 [Sphaerochaetaceae bacterium]|nr:hypothetical protein [Sphaerochaetaceae bacterium]